MCGIAGILQFDDSKPNLSELASMLKVLEPRGPDDEGVWSEGSIALGHRRLSIIDLSQKAHQPLSDDNATLVFNGTIYNYKELRAELEAAGYQFVSAGDTEVILKAYQVWGKSCVTKFHGMFAFCLWDKNHKTLFMARDRIGIKPLYYSLQANRIIFASNPQALLKTKSIDSALDYKALHFHFSLHAVIPAPRTILRGIKKLNPAHTMSFKSDGTCQKKKYWRLDSNINKSLAKEDWLAGTKTLLEKAVRRRIEAADVPVGVLLSGGLDSSLLTALLVNSGIKNLKTFSIGFEDAPEEKGHEFGYSDQVVDMYQTEHYKFKIPNSRVLRRLPAAIANMAEPMFGQDAAAFFLLAEKVADEVKVVQSGQGADELFAGYFWYQKMINIDKSQEVQTFHDLYVDREHQEINMLLDTGIHDVTRLWLKDKFNTIRADNMLDKVLNLDITNLIADDPVKRIDNMTMAWGLEARVPFLDHELVEFVARMPQALKLHSDGKGILKELAADILPHEVVNRPKGYFPMPALKYVRGGFLNWMQDVLLSDTARQRGLYNERYVTKFLERPTAHFTKIKGSKLWQLALTESWLQINNI